MIEKINNIKSKLNKLEQLEYEKLFVQKWSGFKTSGIQLKKLKPFMDDFVSDFRKAFGTDPKWFHRESTIYTSQKEVDRVNLNTFKLLFVKGVGL